MSPQKVYDIYPPRQKEQKRKIIKEKKGQSRAFKNKFALGQAALKAKKQAVFSVKKGLFFLFGLLILVASVLHVFSRGKVEIQPKIEKISFEEELLIVSEATASDFDKKVLAGQLFVQEEEKNQTFKATGKAPKEIKATGEITVYNNYHLDQVLVAATRFISAEGKLFYSIEKITVPAKSNRQISVEAAEPGPDYNIKPSTFSIPGLLGSPRYASVYGKSLNNMSGGFIGETSQASEKDLREARIALLATSQSELEKKLSEAAEPSFWLALEGIEIAVLEEKSSVEPAAAAEQFDFGLKVRAQGLAPLKSELEEFARSVILAGISEDKELNSESLELAVLVEKKDYQAGRLSIKLIIEAEISARLSLEELRQALAGKSVKEARSLLADEARLEKATVQVFPFWRTRIPSQEKRIEIKLTY